VKGKTALTRVWHRKWTILYWAVFIYLLGLALVLATGMVWELIIDLPPTAP
jgi:hypothetical protein